MAGRPNWPGKVTPSPKTVELADGGAGLVTGVIYDAAGNALTPKRAVISHAVSGDNTLVAAVTGKKIRVLSVFAVATGTVSVRFESNAGGTALTGVMPLVAQSVLNMPLNPIGWFETVAGQLLNLELSGAVALNGVLIYVEV